MLSKILPANNFHVLAFNHNFTSSTIQTLTSFYDFNLIKNNYFIIKDIEFSLFYRNTVGGTQIVQEVAYDNAAKTVNANTRYSIAATGTIKIKDLLNQQSSIGITIKANGAPIGILDSTQYSAANENLVFKDLFCYVPNKLASDFEIIIKPPQLKDAINFNFFPTVYCQITGFTLNEDQLKDLKAGTIQQVQIIDSKQVRASGILKNPQAPDKPEFFYE